MALKITGSPRQSRRLMELFEPGKCIVYNANIVIEVANKGPIDYCLWCVKTQSMIIYFDGEIDDAKALIGTFPPGLHTTERIPTRYGGCNTK